VKGALVAEEEGEAPEEERREETERQVRSSSRNRGESGRSRLNCVIDDEDWDQYSFRMEEKEGREEQRRSKRTHRFVFPFPFSLAFPAEAPPAAETFTVDPG
jgi:hypothetical protein